MNPTVREAANRYIERRLIEAGGTLLSMPAGLQRRQLLPDYLLDRIHQRHEARGQALPTPSARAIDEMDDALRWLALIPAEPRALRRVVGARMLISPITGRHIYSWRAIGRMAGVDHHTVQRMWRDGIAAIAAHAHPMLTEAA